MDGVEKLFSVHEVCHKLGLDDEVRILVRITGLG